MLSFGFKSSLGLGFGDLHRSREKGRRLREEGINKGGSDFFRSKLKEKFKLKFRQDLQFLNVTFDPVMVCDF